MKFLLQQFDFVNLIAACSSYILWQWSMSVPTMPIYVPPNDSSVLYPIIQSEIFPRKSLEYFIFLGTTALFICFSIINIFFPKIIREFRFFTLLWTFVTSVSTASIITCLAKSYVGWPRPTMRTKCGPEANYTTCRLNGTKRDKEFISWPSAHATEAGSAGVFVAFFVQAVFVEKNLLVSFVSAVLFLGFGVYVGGSRIKDFKHHPDDVTAGLLIGAGVSYFIWTNMKKKIFTVEKKPIEFAPEANEMHDVDQFDES